MNRTLSACSFTFLLAALSGLSQARAQTPTPTDTPPPPTTTTTTTPNGSTTTTTPTTPTNPAPATTTTTVTPTATTTTTTTPTTTTTVTTATTPYAMPDVKIPAPGDSVPGVGTSLAYATGKQELVKGVVWKASASIGFSMTSGNSNVVSLSGSGNVSRNDGTNKIALVVDGVYGFSQTLVLLNDTGDGIAHTPDQVGTQQATTAAFFLAKLRYDRFFTANNSIYITALSGFDLPASLQVKVAGQAGYARQILKTRMHELSAEVGYDFTWDRLIPPDIVPDSFQQDVFLHSGRIFLGYQLAIGGHTGIRATAEALINFNTVHIGDRDVDPGQATMFNGKVEFTTKIWKPLAFRAAFTARYNNAPALNTVLKYDPENVLRYNQPLDTLTEVGLVMQFL